MKFKHKLKSTIKKDKTTILSELGIKEKNIPLYIAGYNLYKLGIFMCGIEITGSTDILLKNNIISQEDIDKNMEEIKEKIANGESNSKICEYYGV